ncbi:MAG: GntR family transcriptional regulator [SAR86 cluster bacterium]|uniref:GntR family transcriptional regulator n=1 Tax=SAR86 cluster bacterium TaxID=2030880 RepID=A0A2A5B5P7_9GAMM|nr:MAG: GntR family transcriptional regulator [SAR86 cluster bacterium]
MIKVDQFYTLTVSQIVEAGFILAAKELGDALLPKGIDNKSLLVGDSVEVFLYRNAADILVATTKKPKARVGEFAYLSVAATTEIGAFLDWGLPKDVLAPFAEQHRPMHEGHSYLVYLYLDKIDGRITATSKIDKVLDDDKAHDFKNGQSVDLIIANSTDLGFKAIINHSHWGVLYANDVFQRLSFGQSISGYIKHVRPDGKIDLTLQVGKESRDKYTKAIIDLLGKENGFVALHDKSDPQTIARVLGMSKGAFKKSIGSLYRQQIITIEDNGIRLLQELEPAAESIAPDNTPDSATNKHERIANLNREPIELYKILKFEGLVGSGGEAKTMIADGLVLLNGKVETQKRKKIMSGDVIEIGAERIRLQLENKDDQ